MLAIFFVLSDSRFSLSQLFSAPVLVVGFEYFRSSHLISFRPVDPRYPPVGKEYLDIAWELTCSTYRSLCNPGRYFNHPRHLTLPIRLARNLRLDAGHSRF